MKRRASQPPEKDRMGAPTGPSSLFSTRWLTFALFLATLLAYLPSLSGDFLWDDAGHVTRADLQPLDGLARIWTEPGATQQYYPLLHSAFWVEHKLWGDHPLGYRLLNVLLHATSACLFAALLCRLRVPGAWLAAFIFALHPVCVESVAWISEQKNTLSLVFYLSAALAYLRFDEIRRTSTYAAATAFFVAALMTKTTTATLPAALLVVIAWQRARLEWKRDFLPLGLWLILGIGAGLTTVWAEHTLIGARTENFPLSFTERCLLAGRVLWFYLGKLLWPSNLTFIYPRWTINPAAISQWLFPLAAFAATTVLLFKRRLRGVLVAWLLFVGSLVPALGFFNVYPFLFSFVADHFQYLACLSIVAACAAGLTHLGQRMPARAGFALSLILVATLGVLTARQSTLYRDVFALYETTLQRNPGAWMAYTNLAKALTDSGRAEEAVPLLERALALRPNYPEAENNLGHTLTLLGRAPEGIRHLEKALSLQPDFPEAHNHLGIALMGTGDTARGLAAFREAIRLRPRYPTAHLNLGLALARSGQTQEAIGHFEKAVQFDPQNAEAELNWAIGLTLTNHFPAAVPHFERALQLAPDFAQAHRAYARALDGAGNLSKAIVQFRAALALMPDSPDVHMDLALALRKAGQLTEAGTHYQEAQTLRVQNTPAR